MRKRWTITTYMEPEDIAKVKHLVITQSTTLSNLIKQLLLKEVNNVTASKVVRASVWSETIQPLDTKINKEV